jgi:hypothetical protein
MFSKIFDFVSLCGVQKNTPFSESGEEERGENDNFKNHTMLLKCRV